MEISKVRFHIMDCFVRFRVMTKVCRIATKLNPHAMQNSVQDYQGICTFQERF
ncbi:hypothetical protein [Helicobacter sp. MIT 05-5294]|uniref:hypothetical protein n=1 Tax=Helicobacter sp. MIT 05-5294 TaxID=1548150 RepID=UPI0018841DC5|nr:hypothetical protein [Helicobacter sp. MIT 05-5294]